VNYFTLSLEFETCNRSPAISLTAFDTRPPDLPPAPLMDTDFAIICSLVRRRRPQIRFLSIGPYLCLHAPFRPHLAVTPLRFATLHLHQVGTGLSPASCQTCAAYKKKAWPEATPISRCQVLPRHEFAHTFFLLAARFFPVVALIA
jgi:hypothetical protein